MKRIINIIMIIMFVFLFSACGDGNSASKTVSYNETIATNNWELSFTQVGVGGNLNTSSLSSDYLMPGNEDPIIQGFQGEKYEKAYVADSEHTYVAVHFTIKYLGKNKMNTIFDNLHVEFGDGYSFSDAPYANTEFYYKSHNGSEYNSSPSYIDIEPLSDEMDIIKVFIVPKQVETDTSTSLKIVVKLDGTSYYLDVR